jgi:hypothetical protein
MARTCPRLPGLARYRLIRTHAGEMITMQAQAEQVLEPDHAAAAGADERVLLLAEVDFKWLMAGQGWRVDTTRFHGDRAYAARFLRLAMASPSLALRDCAALLMAQMGRADR